MSYFVVAKDAVGNEVITMVNIVDAEADGYDIGRLADTYPDCIYFEAFLVVENIEVTIEEKLNDYTKCVVKIDDVIRFIGRNY